MLPGESCNSGLWLRTIAPACRRRGSNEALGKRTAIKRFFGLVFLIFHLQRNNEIPSQNSQLASNVDTPFSGQIQ